MSTYKFMEMAFHNPQNRKHFFLSKEAVKKPFLKENRHVEMWRSMFLYRTENPTEEDPMFGNFYVECDIPDFQTNRDVMTEVSDFLNKTFQIPYLYMNYFFTNRSIWLSVPAKVFGCFGSIKLNKIYKQMALEIDKHLVGKGYKNAIDLSIYKWNGLIHSLGSYLKKSSRWVTKFTYYDLDSALNLDDIIKAKYDNFFNLSDVKTIPEAKEWYQTTRLRVLFNQNKQKDSHITRSCERKCMLKLEEIGYVEENRNLHIYSYALHLKELGYNTEQAIERVKNTFDMDYVHLRECERTVKSAIEGNKRFNCAVVKQLLNPDLFDCDDCCTNKDKDRNTFIVPRLFIEKLQEGKAHYNTYKYLLHIVQYQQKHKSDFVYPLQGEKYKKLVISRFKKIEELGIAQCNVVGNEIICSLNKMDYEVYQSHIVIPDSFLEDNRFKKMKNELKVLMELWRSSILGGKNSTSLFFNVKYNTLVKRLRVSMITLIKLISKLKKERFVFGRKLFTYFTAKEVREYIKNLIRTVKSKKDNRVYTQRDIMNFDFDVDEIADTKELSLLIEETLRNSFCKGIIYI